MNSVISNVFNRVPTGFSGLSGSPNIFSVFIKVFDRNLFRNRKLKAKSGITYPVFRLSGLVSSFTTTEGFASPNSEQVSRINVNSGSPIFYALFSFLFLDERTVLKTRI